MAGSLFDQLKKSGLVNEHKAKQIKKEKHQQRIQSKQKKSTLSEQEELANNIAQAQKAQAEQTRLLNLQRQAQQAEKERQAQVRQIIQTHQVKGFEGDIAYHFNDENQIKTLYLKPDIRQKLVAGALQIVRTPSGYALLPEASIEKIIARDASIVVGQNNAQPNKTALSAEDEAYYAKFEIPDDLVW